MSEKKSMVIKVKYPTSGKRGDTRANTAAGMVTDWNYQRLGMALGALLFVIMVLSYFMGDENQAEPPELTNVSELAIPAQQSDTESKPPITSVTGESSPTTATQNSTFKASQSVTRSQLASNINRNEPVDKIAVPLRIGRKETLWIYYFAELKGMKNKTVYHEWLLNGELVSQKKVNVSSDPWRTASRQMITYTMNNEWEVRLADDAGNKLDEMKFNLELK